MLSALVAFGQAAVSYTDDETSFDSPVSVGNVLQAFENEIDSVEI